MKMVKRTKWGVSNESEEEHIGDQRSHDCSDNIGGDALLMPYRNTKFSNPKSQNITT